MVARPDDRDFLHDENLADVTLVEIEAAIRRRTTPERNDGWTRTRARRQLPAPIRSGSTTSSATCPSGARTSSTSTTAPRPAGRRAPLRRTPRTPQPFAGGSFGDRAGYGALVLPVRRPSPRAPPGAIGVRPALAVRHAMSARRRRAVRTVPRDPRARARRRGDRPPRGGPAAPAARRDQDLPARDGRRRTPRATSSSAARSRCSRASIIRGSAGSTTPASRTASRSSRCPTSKATTLDGRAGHRDGARRSASSTEVARIVAAAHAAGVVHGDLKPQNVVVRRSGGVLRARLRRRAVPRRDAPLRRLRRGPAGTLPYLAPECLDAARRTQRSDVYGLGAVLFELVTRPAAASGADAGRAAAASCCTRTRRSRASSRPGSIRDLEAVLARALARDPERRYATMAAFAVRPRDALAARRAARRAPRRARSARGRAVGAAAPGGRGARWRSSSCSSSVAALGRARQEPRLERYLERARLRVRGDRSPRPRAAEAHLVRHARLADHRRLEDLEAARARARSAVARARRRAARLAGSGRVARATLDGHRAGARRAPRPRRRRRPSALGAGRLAARPPQASSDLRERARAAARRGGGVPAGAARRRGARSANLRAYLERLEASLPRVRGVVLRRPPPTPGTTRRCRAVVEGLERFAGDRTGTLARRRAAHRRTRSALESWLADDRERVGARACGRSRIGSELPALRRPRHRAAARPRAAPAGTRDGLWEFLHVLSGDAGAESGSDRESSPETGDRARARPGRRARGWARGAAGRRARRRPARRPDAVADRSRPSTRSRSIRSSSRSSR